MSYHVYTTRGIILAQYPTGESDRIYRIMTRDFGMVHARALGVRKENSKLRGSLEPVSLSIVSLVRGKEYWRLTSAEFTKKIKKSQPLLLLEKLVVGEVPQAELFDDVEKHLDSAETVLVSRILYHLGYLKESDLVLEESNLIRAINEGIEASHLL